MFVRGLDVSERRACRVLGQARSTQRREPKIGEDEDELVARMTQLASEYGRYGYLRITALLRREGWQVNHKRIERLWEARRPEGTGQTAQAATFVVARRILYSTAAGL